MQTTARGNYQHYNGKNITATAAALIAPGLWALALVCGWGEAGLELAPAVEKALQTR